MTRIKAHVSSVELEARYKTAVDLVGKSHFQASSGYEVDLAELLWFSELCGKLGDDGMR